MECPQCHFDNPPGSIRCTKCDSDFNLAGVTMPSAVDTVAAGAASGWSRPAQPATGVSGVSQAFQPGSVLGGRYEILQLLGEGGMGAVYKARDREVDRLVALKIIRPELANQPEVLRRFKQELILARKVTHKNVIRIFDLGEADGIKFISMDFIEGQDLRSLLRQKGKLAPEEAVNIMLQVGQALDAAHSEGVVHRDLKPQNIMIDAQGRATVMDFGIARSMELTGMTQTGALIGTPEYMSPEQAKGQEVDARSDLFTLGIIFYELLTGKTPYQADTVLGLLLKRTQERARPPIELDPAIPRYLNDVVVRCLEIEARARYQKASEIVADLEAQRRPPPPSLFLRMPRLRMVEGHPIRWIAAALIAVPLITLTIIFRAKIFAPPSTVTPTPSTPAISLAIVPFRNASGDAQLDWLGSALAGMLTSDVGQSASLRAVSSDRIAQILHDLQMTPQSSLDPSTLRHVAESSNAQMLVWGQYAKLGDAIRIDATLELQDGRTVPLKADAANEKALPQAVDQLARSIRQNLALSPSVIKELEAQAFKPSTQSLPALRDYDEGLQLLRQGRNIEAEQRLRASTKDDPQFALAYSKLAEAEANLGHDSDAEQSSRQAVDLSQNLPPQEKYRIEASHAEIMKDYAKAIESYENLAKVAPGDTDVRFALGRLYEETGDFDKSRQNYDKVLNADPKYADALLARGRVEIKSGNASGGLDYLNRALTQAILVGNGEEQALIRQATGIAYKIMNKPDDALTNYQESLKIQRRLGQQRGVAASLNEMGEVYSSMGKPSQALPSFNEALKIRREIGAKKEVGDTLNDLANLYDNRGDHERALGMFRESLQIQRDAHDERYEALCLSNIGDVYLEQGKYDDALTYFQQALGLREKLGVPGDIADTVHNLAETNVSLGQYDQALSQYLRAVELHRRAGDQRSAALDSNGLATLFAYQGRYGAALSAEQEALKTFRDLQEHSTDLADILSGYGRALGEAGRGAEAQSSLDEALKLARASKDDAKVAEVLNAQGDCAFYRGDLKSAGSLYQQALQAASRAKDKEQLRLSRFNLARLAIEQGHSRQALNALKSLGQEADSLGLKDLAVECAVYRAQALIDTKAYDQARQELDQALLKGEKLGLRELLARSYYLMATALRLSDNSPDAMRHYQHALALLQAIQKEPGADKVLSRADLSSIYKESVRWSLGAKS
ncbi:MAG TPA: tetratricopeptide repeat protein [Terriglobia bacterium]|nr:tetratricopeptide repeat protein [Terriglobia bacterium]